MGCGTKLVSIVLLVFTLVFFLIGLALLGGGIWMLVGEEKLFYALNLINQKTGNNEDVKNEIERISQQRGVVATAGAILVAAGAVSTIISFFGCCGTIKQSKCLLGIYAGTIGVLLGVQIAAAVVAILYKNKVIPLAKSELLQLQNKYLISFNDFLATKKQPHTAVSLVFNYMFVSLKCCGINSTRDAAQSKSWLESNRTWLNRGNMSVPAACCRLVNDDARNKLLANSRWDLLPEFVSSCPMTGVGIYDTACMAALETFISAYSTWIIIGCACFAGAQLLVIIFTTCLICSISDKYK